MSHRFHCATSRMALVLLAMAVTQAAAAQNTPAPRTLDPKACADELRLPQPNSRSAPQPSAPSNQTLSEKLEQTEGVICPPPGVDPEIGVPPPGGGKTPVIQPPGSPGGDPTVRPK